jgi:tRNA1Val (adenine37-N6)-methyltransferase
MTAMSGIHFRFKRFSVSHDKTTHKVGTDGVLIAAWVNVQYAHAILEIGTGSGVMALVLAQRTGDNVHIDAVEIEKDSAQQAMENVAQSPWPTKVSVHNISIQAYQTAKRYDLVVSNPPFFVNSSRPPEKNRSNARHTGELTFETLIETALKFLKPEGRFALILPFTEAIAFIEKAGQKNLYCHRRCEVQSRKHKPIERILLEFGLKANQTLTDNLVIHGSNDEWSEEYVKLTGDFYLKM